MNLKNLDIRDVFFENIKNLFLKNKDFYILTNDADVFSLQQIKNHERFIDAGVCEQNLINIASGLARKNKKVLIYGFCNFLCHRAYEQIKINIASMNLPIAIVGIGPGFSFPYDGPTHHGIQDISNILTIPEFEIYNLSDNKFADYMSKNIFKIKGPKYIRLEKGVCPSNFNKADFLNGFEFTPSSIKKETLVITTGYFSQLVEKSLQNYKNYSLISLLRLKNFNKKKFINILKKNKKILIYDENTFYGGISPIINKIIIDYNLIGKKIYYLTCPEDKQIFRYNTERNKILDDLGIGEIGLSKKIKYINKY